LIGPRLVLGAAHCADADTRFQVGAWEGVSDGYEVDIKASIIHEDYSPSGFDHDIMIFQLEDESPHPYIRLEKGEVNGGKFTVIGFGDTDIGAGLALATKLQEVELDYVDNDTCDEGHGGDGFVTEDMLCAAGDSKDSCIGDSGGPLFIRGDTVDEDRLVGLVSWGRGCAMPGFAGGTKWMGNSSMTILGRCSNSTAVSLNIVFPLTILFLALSFLQSLHPNQLFLRLDRRNSMHEFPG
jgi:secreted trypsin-like serine protease